MQNTNVAHAAENPTKVTRPSRPNYNLIHSKPLPLNVDPLPPLFPHNPLSVLSIFLKYLSQVLWSPFALPPRQYIGTFSPETRSVHITDEISARALWESGFFGKGTLSRSEPTWLDREKRRRGLIIGESAEDVTRRRREERKAWKNERARKEREAIELKMKEEQGGATPTNGSATAPIHSTVSDLANDNASLLDEAVASPAVQGSRRAKTAKATSQAPALAPIADSPTSTTEVVSKEHLQLTTEEAFFLAYGLGVLQIIDSTTEVPIPREALFKIFRACSVFPPALPISGEPFLADPFLPSYAAYHHFRSLGWVVRPGMKFAVDWMLYNRGPVFSHAEFAVIVAPSYSDPFWKTSDGRRRLKEAGVREKAKSWWWLHMVNRVQAQVRKSLVLAFVEIPPPFESQASAASDRAESVSQLLARVKVREIVLKRWIPNRNRDVK